MVLSSSVVWMLLLISVGQGLILLPNKNVQSILSSTCRQIVRTTTGHANVGVTALTAIKRPLSSSFSSSATASSSSSTSFSLSRTPCKIVVVGVGGAGCNAVTRMLQTSTSLVQQSDNNKIKNNYSNQHQQQQQHREIEFWAVNTDYQALGKAMAAGAKVLTIGGTGLGAGGDPTTGKQAAEASKHEIRNMIVRDADLVFITAGMGGGTGSGAAPVIAALASAQGCLTVAVVTTPFRFEGMHRKRQAMTALQQLQATADTVIPVSNDKLLTMIPSSTPLEEAFLIADDILRQGIVGIANVIVRPGLINVDFADVQSILQKKKTIDDDEEDDNHNNIPENAWMGIGVGTGKNAAMEAAEAAIACPLLEQPMESATSLVFCISGGPTMTLNQVNTASQRIYQSVNPLANVIFGAVIDEEMGDDISITVLASGGGGGSSDGDVRTSSTQPAQTTTTTTGSEAPPSTRSSTFRPAAAPARTTGSTASTTNQKVPSFLKNRKPS